MYNIYICLYICVYIVHVHTVRANSAVFFPSQVEERFGPLIPQESSDQEAEP